MIAAGNQLKVITIRRTISDLKGQQGVVQDRTENLDTIPHHLVRHRLSDQHAGLDRISRKIEGNNPAWVSRHSRWHVGKSMLAIT